MDLVFPELVIATKAVEQTGASFVKLGGTCLYFVDVARNNYPTALQMPALRITVHGTGDYRGWTLVLEYETVAGVDHRH